MTQHTLALEIARPIPMGEALPGLGATLAGPASARLAEPAVIPATVRIAEPASEKPQTPVMPPVEARPVRRGKLRQVLLFGAALAGLAGLADFGWNYWTVGYFEVSTDDAYVQADSTTIAPKVSGYIAQVLVRDNARVKAGQVLARIDDRDYRTALNGATATLAEARAALLSKEALLNQQQSIIAAARAAVDVDEAKLTFAEQEDRRYSALAAKGYGSVQHAEHAGSDSASAQAIVARDKASLASAVAQLSVLKAQTAEARATVARDAALQTQAELNLSYTTLTSPVDGVIGNRSLRVGQYVQAGTQLMAVVPLEATYVVANYKETQLTHVRPGQQVEIAVDMFPGVTLRGHVDSIAPASGQEFALLPPDNATGNFTKIVQRIPVKIVLDPHDPLAGRLRPGMSVSPTIETKARMSPAVTAQAHAG